MNVTESDTCSSSDLLQLTDGHQLSDYSWRYMYLTRPKPRYNGCYISKISYFRWTTLNFNAIANVFSVGKTDRTIVKVWISVKPELHGRKKTWKENINLHRIRRGGYKCVLPKSSFLGHFPLVWISNITSILICLMEVICWFCGIETCPKPVIKWL